MIIVGSKDIGPTRYILEYLKNIKDVYWVKTKKNNLLIKNFQQLKKYKEAKSNLILTGSCIGNGLDKSLIIHGRKKGIKTASFVEHWSLLKERFLLKKNTFLKPDYLFVIDEDTKKFYIKKLGFKSKKIFVIGNNYLAKLKKKKIKERKNLKNILFISQPHQKLQRRLDKMFNIKNYFGFTEYDVINNILEHIDLNLLNLTIKLNLNKKINKFNFLKKENIKIKFNIDKAEIIKNYDLIIGMDSMLLLELYLMGARVLSIRPSEKNLFYGNKFNSFPIIKNLKNITELNKIYKNYKSNNLNFKKHEIKDIINKLHKL